jgi:hypothetical protein
MYGRLEWQLDNELSAFFGLALNADVSAMGLDDFAADVEPKSQAA